MPTRWSCFSIPVFALIVVTLGCRGTGPQRQPLVLTEDPNVRTSETQAPPQRLAVSDRPSKSIRPEVPRSGSVAAVRSAKVPSDNAITGGVKPVAHSQELTRTAQLATKAQPTAKLATKSQSPPSSYKPSRSEAVEALLAANRVSTRSKQKASAESQSKIRARSQSPPSVSPLKTAATASSAARKTPARATSSLQDSSSLANGKQTAEQAVRQTAKQGKAKAAPVEVAKTTVGKTVRFTDLPDDVKRRAMDRLIQNLAKEAVQSTQPTSPKHAVANAMKSLPKLAPLRKTKPDVPPTRIAAARSKSPRTLSARAPQSKPRLATKSVTEPRNQVANPQVASSRVASSQVASPQAKAALFEKAVPSKRSNEPTEATPTSSTTSKPLIAQASRFELPPMDQLREALPKSDGMKISMAIEPQPSPVDWTAGYQEHPTHAVESDLQVQQSAEETAGLTVSRLAQELESIPDELQRDAFRVSRVGLPSPDDYFAAADAEVQQASSQMSTQTDHLESVELANSVETVTTLEPTDPAPQAPASRTNAMASPPSDSSNHQHIASVSRALAFDLPDHRDAKPSTESSIEPTTESSTASSSVRPMSIPDVAKAESPSSRREEKALPPIESSEDAIVAAKPNPQSLSDQDLYDALLSRLNDPARAETPAEQSRRQIMARHLMVLAGDRDSAVAEMQGLSKEEQQFLRNQLEGLYAMVDPKGHPVAGRRFSEALPKLRQATQHLSAAADSLEVRSLDFCTEIEAYGQVKPFPKRQFAAGQAVILYCEVDRFTARKTEAGYETYLKGSYDVFNENGEKIVSQLLPADKQVSRNFLRDYFVAYQMNLPSKLTPGKYRLQLTMEDIGGEKYGQSEIEFVITKAAVEIRQTGGTL